MTASLARTSGSPAGSGLPPAAISPRHSPRLAPATANRSGPPPRLQTLPEGMLQVHTAPFRGSFGGVFSQALRTAGLGSRVLVSQFLKGGVDQGVEASLWLCGRLQWLRPAVAACLEQPAGEAGEAATAVAEVWNFSREQLLSGAVDLMVLDELGLAIELGYVALDEVVASLERRPAHLDVMLTGPSMPAVLMAMADQVTQLRRGL